MTRDAWRDRILVESCWPRVETPPLLETTLGDMLRDAATREPDRPALVEGAVNAGTDRRWTYGEHVAASERIARALLGHFSPGERVAIWCDNRPEYQLLFYGCALAGLVLVTINPAYKIGEARHVLDTSGASGLFVMSRYRGYECADEIGRLRPSLPHLRKVFDIDDLEAFAAGGAPDVTLPAVAPRDPCCIMFTSGTTGRQKGVIFHHLGVINMARFTQMRGGLAEGGVFVNPMPMFHIGALGHAAVGAVALRATHVLAREWSAELFMSLAARERGTYSLLVPTMIEAILAHPRRGDFDLSNLKNLVSGASVVEASLIRRTKAALGATICNIYGQTEMQGVITGVHRDDTEADMTGTIGQPMPQVDVKVADPATGAVLPLGAQGEICARGYQIMPGYFNMPRETDEAIDAEGWLKSGDLGTMDARGFLRITSRIKDMIIRGGENIYPREIEALIAGQPGVAAVAVVGAPDAVWGEQVGAVVIGEPGAAIDPRALHDLCRATLAAYKAPRLWYVVDAFPTTETGKLQKFRLVEAIVSGRLKPVATF